MKTAEDTVVDRLDQQTQLELVEQLAAVRREAPLLVMRTPNDLPMSVRVTAAGDLGWTSGPEGYRYVAEHPETGKPWPAIPRLWTEIADRVIAARQLAPVEWDSAIVNFYGPGASLGWHRDQSERDTSQPIVTISLGDAATWAVRRQFYEASETTRCRLESGDVTLLAGASRSWMHTIERVHPSAQGQLFGQPFSPLSGPGRVSITLRRAG